MLVEATLVLADPVQQVAVAPERCRWLLVQLVVAQQLLSKKVLGHVQAPRKVRQRWLAALQDLQQQALEAGGQLVAERAKAAGIEAIVFDRGGYKYHGRVAALAEAAREGGLKF